MSVEASATTSEIWARLEGRTVNGVFPLRRYLGGSDHSGVFLTEFAKRGIAEVALKLLPASAVIADACLARWRMAGGLAHPHLMRLLEAGRCQLEGAHYLYLVMEYADQNLAQLLERRALTDDETREMLRPVLSALAFLHERKFVQGQLTPSNVLVVGDQLKLASDTIHPVGDLSERIGAMVPHEPPEARDGAYSPAGDVWALGVSLCEALTRRPPSGLHDGSEGIALPPDLPAAFREIIARCVSHAPHERVTVADIEVWLRGGEVAPAALVAPESAAEAREPTRPEPSEPDVVTPETSAAASARLEWSWRKAAPILGALVVFVLFWAGLRALRSDRAPEPIAPPSTPAATSIPNPVPAPAVSTGPPPVASADSTRPANSEAALSLAPVHEAIPDVPRRARQTIRGHIRVSVRVIVEKDGTVFAALTERAGPSRYFARLAVDAAKKWTFTPADSEGQRLVLVRFDFSRQGTTARAAALQ